MALFGWKEGKVLHKKCYILWNFYLYKTESETMLAMFYGLANVGSLDKFSSLCLSKYIVSKISMLLPITIASFRRRKMQLKNQRTYERETQDSACMANYVTFR